jgi:hypothetical protein
VFQRYPLSGLVWWIKRQLHTTILKPHSSLGDLAGCRNTVSQLSLGFISSHAKMTRQGARKRQKTFDRTAGRKAPGESDSLAKSEDGEKLTAAHLGGVRAWGGVWSPLSLHTPPPRCSDTPKGNTAPTALASHGVVPRRDTPLRARFDIAWLLLRRPERVAVHGPICAAHVMYGHGPYSYPALPFTYPRLACQPGVSTAPTCRAAKEGTQAAKAGPMYGGVRGYGCN